MTTQREPDTSAEGGAPLVSKLYNALAHLLDLYDREDVPTPEHAVALDAARQVIALADAAGQVAPVPPPVEDETSALLWILNELAEAFESGAPVLRRLRAAIASSSPTKEKTDV